MNLELLPTIKQTDEILPGQVASEILLGQVASEILLAQVASRYLALPMMKEDLDNKLTDAAAIIILNNPDSNLLVINPEENWQMDNKALEDMAAQSDSIEKEASTLLSMMVIYSTEMESN